MWWKRAERRNAVELDRTILFDADAFYRAGRIPSPFLAFPSELADSDGLPVDDEAIAFLAAMQRRGVPFGAWRLPPGSAHAHVWVVVKHEDSRLVSEAMAALRADGTIGRGYIRQLSERLMGLVG